MAEIALVTGSAGLIGSEACELFSDKGLTVVGIDNDMRAYFFGPEASTLWNRQRLLDKSRYQHKDIDIRNRDQLENLFREFSHDIKVIIHTAAQPSHDWAAKEPFTDFSVNALGTLNLLEMARQYCPQSVFIFTSTNKVYGDRPNDLPLQETETRWEIEEGHECFDGIDEMMSIDQSKHSLFGASKVAADILVQEYGRYFDMKTACFRGGCLTGPNHSGAQLHGFLAYLMKCCVKERTYEIFGYKGKQVRDNIHAYDLVSAFWHFYQEPRCAEVYNIGGGRANSCSLREAVALCEEISGKTVSLNYQETPRAGDHIWYISSLKKFKDHFPSWDITIGLKETLQQIHDRCVKEKREE